MTKEFYQDQVSPKFCSGELKEHEIEYAIKNNFVIDMYNGRTSGFRRDDVLIRRPVFSGGDSMTMAIRVSGGRDEIVEP